MTIHFKRVLTTYLDTCIIADAYNRLSWDIYQAVLIVLHIIWINSNDSIISITVIHSSTITRDEYTIHDRSNCSLGRPMSFWSCVRIKLNITYSVLRRVSEAVNPG